MLTTKKIQLNGAFVMQFEHEEHRSAYLRVEEYLSELFEDVLKEDGHFYVRYGSTVIEISVEPYGPEEASVFIMSHCVQGVEIDDELAFRLLELNHALAFGAFSAVGQDIFYSHSLFGRTLERSNLLGAIAAVAEIADEWDDRIVVEYGGQRALDRIRDTGGRRRRQESVKV
ncbi:MAG: hypothetical protein AAGN66_00435 [Acidobacteriota bacterium]